MMLDMMERSDSLKPLLCKGLSNLSDLAGLFDGFICHRVCARVRAHV